MKQLRILIAIISFFTLSGCSLIYMMVATSPAKTWYFTNGFDKKVTENIKSKLILDSINISEKAIKLTRNNKDSIYSYWVDVDTLYYYDNDQRIYANVKIVSAQGKILRYLSGWLEPESNDKINLINYKLVETKKGNISFILDDREFFLSHLGDEMGLYHLDIIRPNNISADASLSMIFGGYNYTYSWIEYENQKDDLFVLKKYNYQGVLKDTIYATMPIKWNKELDENYHFEYTYNSMVLIDAGKKYKLKIMNSSF
jgi:hypothetical protein